MQPKHDLLQRRGEHDLVQVCEGGQGRFLRFGAVAQAVDDAEEQAPRAVLAKKGAIPISDLSQLGDGRMSHLYLHSLTSATIVVPPAPVLMSKVSARRLVPSRPLPRPVRL